MTSCALGTATSADPGASSFCAIAAPIYPSPDDTPETKRQILEYLLRGQALCGWTAPGAKPARSFFSPVADEQAQGLPCAPTAEVMKRIAEQQGVPRWKGRTEGGNTLATFVNPANEWIEVAISADGQRTCSIASGGKSTFLNPKPPGEDL